MSIFLLIAYYIYFAKWSGSLPIMMCCKWIKSTRNPTWT